MMTDGAEKLWINPIHSSCPPPILRYTRFGLYKTENDEFLSGAFTSCVAKAVGFEATLFAVARLEASVDVPKPAIFVSMPIGEMKKDEEKIALCMGESVAQTLIVENDVRSKKKVRVLIARSLVRLVHTVH